MLPTPNPVATPDDGNGILPVVAYPPAPPWNNVVEAQQFAVIADDDVGIQPGVDVADAYQHVPQEECVIAVATQWWFISFCLAIRFVQKHLYLTFIFFQKGKNIREFRHHQGWFFPLKVSWFQIYYFSLISGRKK